ncbi:hypothetical protein Taro_023218 [Colocasia esculenta]|uniref:Uncharacterized protein n=1 Tax=Colocasia esculenta TaxID=4460 RepID=A0A843VAR3_COLES|nr:hypothetical protein [Colocasia esculenta]
MRCVLNATALVVAFILPLFGGLRLHGNHMSCAGQSANVSLGKAMAFYVTFRSQPLLVQGRSRCSFFRGFGILAWFSTCSLREDVPWSEGDAVLWVVCVFFVERLFRNTSAVGYPRFCVSQARVFVVLEVCPGTCVVPLRSVSSVLDTLTPVFELYVWLRERRQWDSDFCVKVLPIVECFVVALVWLRFPWWYLVVVGVEVVVVWCDLPLVVFYPFLVWGRMDQLLVSSPVPMCLMFAYEACSLDSGLPVWLIAWVTGCCSSFPVSVWVVRLCGPTDWAQSAHRFSACERDKGMRRILNAMALVVAFMLPLFGSLRLHGWCMSCAGQSADVGLGKATASDVAFRSRREELLQFLQAIQRSSMVFGALSLLACRSHGDQGQATPDTFRYPRFCVSQARVFVVLGLDLSSMTARLRGSSCVVLFGLDTGVMNQCGLLVVVLPIEVCPGVGTVVVVVGEWRLTGCGLTHVVCPVVGTVVSRFCPWWSALWWHWFGCGFRGGVEVVVMWCDLPLVVFYPFLVWGRMDQLLVSGPVPMCLMFACEACSLDSGLPV